MKIAEEIGEFHEEQPLFCPGNSSRRNSVGTLSLVRLDAVAIPRSRRLKSRQRRDAFFTASRRCHDFVRRQNFRENVMVP
ncbi:hypothetical protein NP118_23475 [Salmonella enterica]|nr:hypothetical protein [Salmonella enterica]